MKINRRFAPFLVSGAGSRQTRQGARFGPPPPIAPYTSQPLPARKDRVALIFPIIGSVNWRDSYNENRGAFRHTGIDIRAPKMRPVLAPFDGTLGFKIQTFWIYGDNGYKCLGTHLNDDTPGKEDNRADPDAMFAPNLRPGDRVTAGQLIGYVGNSGDATGPHLHFELFAPDGSLVNPFTALKEARHLSAPQLPTGAFAEPPALGETQALGCLREWNAATGALSLQGVARRAGDGRTEIFTKPTPLRVTLPAAVIAAAGGSDGIGAAPPDRIITLFLTAKIGTPRKIVLPLS